VFFVVIFLFFVVMVKLLPNVYDFFNICFLNTMESCRCTYVSSDSKNFAILKLRNAAHLEFCTCSYFPFFLKLIYF